MEVWLERCNALRLLHPTALVSFDGNGFGDGGREDRNQRSLPHLIFIVGDKGEIDGD